MNVKYVIFAGIMRKVGNFVIGFIAVLCAAGCRSSKGESEALRTGDLLFVEIPADYTLGMGSKEGFASGALNIHVAIFDVDEDGTWIVDATINRGVARYPFEDFKTDFTLNDGSLPRFTVKRPSVSAAQANSFVQNARGYIGQPYDVDFTENNGAMYCSELVYHSYVTADGRYLFEEGPISFKGADGQIPQYWQDIFAWLGKDIPEGNIGIMPSDMMKDSDLETVSVYNL